jgi:preprotein translocase subunit SecF
MFKGVDFWPHGTRLPIMDVRRLFIAGSLVAAIAAIALLGVKGLNFGIDFKGGSLFEVRQTTGTLDVGKVRETLGELGLGEVQIQSLDQPGEILIRVETQKPGEGQNAEQAQQAVEGKVLILSSAALRLWARRFPAN